MQPFPLTSRFQHGNQNRQGGFRLAETTHCAGRRRSNHQFGIAQGFRDRFLGVSGLGSQISEPHGSPITNGRLLVGQCRQQFSFLFGSRGRVGRRPRQAIEEFPASGAAQYAVTTAVFPFQLIQQRFGDKTQIQRRFRPSVLRRSHPSQPVPILGICGQIIQFMGIVLSIVQLFRRL